VIDPDNDEFHLFPQVQSERARATPTRARRSTNESTNEGAHTLTQDAATAQLKYQYQSPILARSDLAQIRLETSTNRISRPIKL
jgi:hypothetical protein